LRRLPEREIDLLRAAMIFAGAGLDSALKELVRDCLPQLLDQHSRVLGRLKEFGSRLAKEEPRAAVRHLSADNPTEALRQSYVTQLVAQSLQGTSDLIRVRDALGLTKEAALTDTKIKALDEFFTARNQIAHELDLQRPGGRGSSLRRSRRLTTTRDQCDATFLIAGAFVVATDSHM